MPRAFGRRFDPERAQHERAHGERQAETREDVGIQCGIDGAVELRPLDDVGDHAFALLEPVAQRRRELFVAPGGGDRVDQQRRLPARTHEAVPEQLEEGARLAALRLREEGIHLDAGARADRREQELTLTPEVGIDRARGQSRGPGDVLEASAFIALLDEYLDSRGQQPVPGRRVLQDGHPVHDNDHYLRSQRTPPPVTGCEDAAVDRPVTLADVEAASETIRGAVRQTPTSPSETLSVITGAHVWLKFENLQFTGAFKERGARNFLALLSPAERAGGVVAASAGNHAQGVAHHARLLDIAATIVMPADTPFTKVSNTAHHGAQVVLEGADYAGALAGARRVARENGATLVPAFDDPRIIAGQGTIGLELFEQTGADTLDAIVVPVGGGGLISGIAIAAKALRPDVRVIGVQVEGYAGMLHALGQAPGATGGPTIAEGIAVAEPGELTRGIVSDLVDDIVVVSEQRIEEAIALGAEIEKTILEGAGAAGLAALLEYPDTFRDQHVGIVLSGGNIDARLLASVLLRALARSGRLVRLRIEVPDRPGVLASVAQIVGGLRANIVDVAQERPSRPVGRDPG